MKNTIRVGGSTALQTADTLYTLYTVFTDDMAYTVNMVYIVERLWLLSKRSGWMREWVDVWVIPLRLLFGANKKEGKKYMAIREGRTHPPFIWHYFAPNSLSSRL